MAWGARPPGKPWLHYLARVGAGEPQPCAERADGYNPLAVVDAIKRKKALIENGDGPVLLETITYYSGHSPSDASSID